MTVSVNKDIFLHTDFNGDLTEYLCNYLNALIDEEFEKEDADFDFIDECADAINSIRDGFIDAVIPVISRKDFMAKLGIRTVRFSKAFAAVIAAAIMLVAVNGIIASATDYNIIEEVSKKVAGFFAQTDKKPDFTEKAEITATTTFTPITVVIVPQRLIVTFDSSFKDEYTIGEKFDPKGIVIRVSFSDGEVKVISSDNYEIITDKDFGKSEKLETVTVKYEKLTETFSVRVLRDEDTKVLNSVYATFPENFNFRTDDINNIDLSGMEVFAVYSDKTEEKLRKSDYTIKTEILPDGKTAMITVKHKSVYASFGIKERSQGEDNE
ncbi:MAG: bacterial Ig-like domain-containing protein [Clostridia bacterium]|nr:bacterial Ig-like domain-containing protein [Clostridia bacterium]